MAKRDYYDILGIDRDASQAEVKRAYRRLARKYHPDVNPGDQEAARKFQEIQEAYEVLSDPLERDKYDQYGYAGVIEAAEAAAADKDEDLFSGTDTGDLYNVSSMSAVAQEYYRATPEAPPTPEPGPDLRYDLEITFEDAAFGVDTQINIPLPYTCNYCNGTGRRTGTVSQTCTRCGGAGEVKVPRYTPSGTQLISTICEECQGRGKVLGELCNQCNGMGVLQHMESVIVKIPPGVDEGSRLRVKGKGAPGRGGGPRGDLYIIVHVRPHEIFERQGYEILCETPVTFWQAALGAEVEVPTLEGKAKMKIPPGTQTNTIFRLRSKGIINPHTGVRGDMHVKVTVVTPTNLTEKQRSLFRKLAQSFGETI